MRELKIYGDINFIKECQKIESITVSLWDKDKVCMCRTHCVGLGMLYSLS